MSLKLLNDFKNAHLDILAKLALGVFIQMMNMNGIAHSNESFDSINAFKIVKQTFALDIFA